MELFLFHRNDNIILQATQESICTQENQNIIESEISNIPKNHSSGISNLEVCNPVPSYGNEFELDKPSDHLPMLKPLSSDEEYNFKCDESDMDSLVSSSWQLDDKEGALHPDFTQVTSPRQLSFEDKVKNSLVTWGLDCNIPRSYVSGLLKILNNDAN